MIEDEQSRSAAAAGVSVDAGRGAGVDRSAVRGAAGGHDGGSVSACLGVHAAGAGAEGARNATPEGVEEWLKVRYPKLRARAKRAGGIVLWQDETGFRSDCSYGRSWSPKGVTPVQGDDRPAPYLRCLTTGIVVIRLTALVVPRWWGSRTGLTPSTANRLSPVSGRPRRRPPPPLPEGGHWNCTVHSSARPQLARYHLGYRGSCPRSSPGAGNSDGSPLKSEHRRGCRRRSRTQPGWCGSRS